MLLPGRRRRWRISGRSQDTPLRWLLLLNGLTCPRNKRADGQGPSGHHVFGNRVFPGRVTRFCGFLCGYLNWILKFCWYNFMLNSLVSTFLEIFGCCFN